VNSNLVYCIYCQEIFPKEKVSDVYNIGFLKKKITLGKCISCTQKGVEMMYRLDEHI
jgi:hypothetical protein